MIGFYNYTVIVTYIGVALSIGLSMFRILTGISIFYFLVPGYLAAIVLSFFVPKIFTAIAFDSGGVASGPMTTTFLLPLSIGACDAVGGNLMTDAFGVVALVALTPLIAIQVMGILYQYRLKTTDQLAVQEADFTEVMDAMYDIFEFEEGSENGGQS